MDPCNSVQDVVRVHLCDSPGPPLYSDICHIYLCKTCVRDHIFDESKLHIVVPVKHRQTVPMYSKCPEHTSKLCELHCDIPICIQCVFSKTHKAHDAVDISKFVERKKNLTSRFRRVKKNNSSLIPRDCINYSSSKCRFKTKHRTIDNSSQ